MVDVTAKPILKWAGGKTRLLPELLKRVPTQHFRRYIEPFAGGAAMFFAMRAAHTNTPAVLADVNVDLIGLYRDVRDELPRMISHLRELSMSPCSRKHYLSVRYCFNHGREFPVGMRSALMLYLNRTCFNGLWRVNSHGKFNVPWGGRPKAQILYYDELEAASLALRGDVVLCSGLGFERTLLAAREGDFVYCDPPYIPASTTSSFTSYAASAFGNLEHVALELAARMAIDRGAHVMLSNSDTAFTRELYDRPPWHLHEASAPRSVGASGRSRGSARELIITSYPV